MNNYAARSMLNRFVVDSQNTVREMVELAVTNWLGAQRFGTNDHYRKELAILAERFLESAKEMEECNHCQHMRRINSIGINRIAADTWGTIYPSYCRAADRGERRWSDSASAYCCGPAQGYW
jgi:hypothetical protein